MLTTLPYTPSGIEIPPGGAPAEIIVQDALGQLAWSSIVEAAFVLDEDDLVSDSDEHIATQQSIKAYVDTVVASLGGNIAGYDADANTPDLDTSPSGVLSGDIYYVTVAGTFFTTPVEVGDGLIAKIDGAAVEADWVILQKNLLSPLVADDIVDDAVTLAKMAPGTAGNIFIYDASGDPAAAATGTAGQVFVSNGPDTAPTMQDNITYTEFPAVDYFIPVAVGADIRMAYEFRVAGTIMDVGAYTQDAGVTGTMTVDLHLNGTTIMDTNKIDIEDGETSSITAAQQPALTTTVVDVGDLLSFHVDTVHSGTAANGLIFWIKTK